MASNIPLTAVDPVSNVPYLHESFVLHIFVPMRYVRRQKPFDDPKFTGCYPEGFRIPTVLTPSKDGTVVKKTKFDDGVTCMLVGKETVGPGTDRGKKYNCVTDTDSTKPGYLNLIPRGSVRQSKSAPAFNRQKSMLMLNNEISSHGKSSRMYLYTQNKLNEASDVTEATEPLTPKRRSARPSNIPKRKKLPDNVDYALALRHPEWPEVAAEWAGRTRNNGWPGKRIEKKILTTGCHVTPGAHANSDDPELEWEYTFFEAERILNKEAISSVQRQCFIAMNLLCMDCLEKKLLSFQQLKSVFYFVCEEINSKLWRNNKAACVNKLLDKLIDCIRNANMPDYFLVKNNTLGHVYKTTLVEMHTTVTKLRENPTEIMLAMTKTCAIVNIFPFYCAVGEMFKPFLADAAEYIKKPDVDKSMKALLTIVDELCNSFYIDHGFEAYEDAFEEVAHYVNCLVSHGVSGFEEAIEYFVKPLQGDEEARRHLESLPEMLSSKNISLSQLIPPTEIWRPIRLCRLLITKFAGGNKGSNMYDHIGCMYHSASTVFVEQKQDALKRADASFKEAIQKSDCGVGTHVDYASYLYTVRRFDECVSLLRKVLAKESKKPSSGNFYGKMEALVADQFVKREIEIADGLEIMSVTYAYYMIAECYIQMKKTTELLQILKQFEEFCNYIKDRNSFIFIGYTYMKINQFNKALSNFEHALETQSEDVSAKRYIEICKKFADKNQSDAEVLKGPMTQLNILGD